MQQAQTCPFQLVPALSPSYETLTSPHHTTQHMLLQINKCHDEFEPSPMVWTQLTAGMKQRMDPMLDGSMQALDEAKKEEWMNIQPGKWAIKQDQVLP